MRSKRFTSRFCSAVPALKLLEQSGAEILCKENSMSDRNNVGGNLVQPWENATPEQMRRLFGKLLLEKELRETAPVLVPEPEVAEFLDPERPEIEIEDIPEQVVDFLEKQDILTEVKKAHLLLKNGDNSLFYKLLREHGEKIIPAIELLRQSEEYGDSALIMGAIARAKTAPKGELDDEDEGQLLEDCKKAKKAIDEMRAEGYDTDILNMMEANLKRSREEQIN